LTNEPLRIPKSKRKTLKYLPRLSTRLKI